MMDKLRQRNPILVPVALLAILLSTQVAAQEQGILRGSVATAARTPLPQAHISVVGTTIRAVADTDGTFRIAALPVGAQTVEVRLIGYTTTSLPVFIESGKEAELQVTLSSIPVLNAVKITGADTIILPEMREFMLRKARGNGTFLTRDEIDRMEARVLTDVLRRVPGMKLSTREGSFGSIYTVQSARTEGLNGGRGCPMLFYVNGVPFSVSSELEINHYVAPNDVAAMEIYTGASQIPAQFNSITLNAHCGVIVIWTRIRNSARSH
jgi:iron complex outermembrane receptor protein